MDSEQNLALYRDLDDSMFGAFLKSLFKTFYRQLFATLLGSMLGSMLGLLYLSVDSALFRQRPGGRQPVGRGVGGRIVVGNGRTTTYRRAITGLPPRPVG
jgi:hypothetical protein